MRTWCVLSVLLLASPALAAKPPKVMVMDFPATNAFPADVVAVLNQFLAGAVRDQGFAVMTPADIGAVIGVERQRQLLGCAEDSCLADLAGAMGTEYIVYGRMAALEKDTALTISLVTSRTALSTQVREVVPSHSSSDLLHAIEKLVPKLMAPARPVDLAAASPKPAPESAGGLQPSSAVGANASEGSGSPVLGWGLVGGGAVALAVGGIFGVMAHNNQNTANEAVAAGNLVPTATSSAIRTDAWVSTGAMTAGIVAAGVGAGVLLWSSR
ncbi:MAG: hypothetical protein JST54_28570 [Deltaproteobacteria bacterium]|nr:hypothetical protein [Deltaproteobacteria bacterium]